MSVIEDSRKVLQDFIAPELRAIDARLAALEKKFDESQVRAEKRSDATEKRIETLEQRLDRRFDQLERRLDHVLTKLDLLSDVQDVKVRLARLEGQQMNASASGLSSSEAA